MSIEKDGMTMNANSSQLPRECKEINQTYSFEVHAGTAYAQDIPGNIFGYELNEFEVETCSLVPVLRIPSGMNPAMRSAPCEFRELIPRRYSATSAASIRRIKAISPEIKGQTVLQIIGLALI